MRLQRMLKLSVIALLASHLTACGFHLRDNYTVPNELDTLSLTSSDEYGPLSRNVKEQLQLNKVRLVLPAENIPSLHLMSESIDERTLSLYQNGRVAEKELTYVVHYRVTLPNVGSDTFSTSVSRSYLDNPLTALAKSVERDVIEEEMRSQAAAQMMRQLAQVKHQQFSADNQE
ncbi:luciferase [Vibrio sp. SM6]|uniref:LPS-assembly lipoprotein LptE n=1 Tax=Vibrio agarilyticus TaxID=2726741 RepID=A0A7X8TSV3_9VIBR|nr:LPS assembly lipoprotein LptE [Vibrio agarilyticus]NLS14178.1 luciferase [Vibrio agarilyticus]